MNLHRRVEKLEGSRRERTRDLAREELRALSDEELDALEARLEERDATQKRPDLGEGGR